MRKKKKQLIDPNTKVLLKRIFTGVLVIGAVALIITGVWHGTRMQTLTIDSVRVSGGETIDHNLLEELAREQLQGTYLGLIPKRFTWFYPQTKIQTDLEKIERVHNVSVDRLGGTELTITFDEYIPHALWCESAAGENCLFLDDAGYAFGKAPKLFGESFLRFIKIGQSPELRDTIMTQEDFDQLLSLSDLLSQQGWYVSYIEIDQAEDIFVQIAGGGELRVNLNQSAEESVENLLVILGSEEFKHIAPGNFQYIDLRYGNKVFVNEEIAVPEEETAIQKIEDQS